MAQKSINPRPIGRPFKNTEAQNDAPIARIGEPAKRQYIGDWMDAQDPPISAADLARATGIDKSTISRWINKPTQIPHEDNLQILASFFNLDDPASLMRHPDDDWLTRKFREHDKNERRRMRQMLEAAFPSKDSKAS